MAFTNFYLIAGGTGSADINAGSSVGAAQATPTTGGSWTNATNTFVATGGTPFATTVAGDYVSIYADGATVTTYVAKVATVVSNVSVILDGTIKYGTAPTDGASNRSAVAGGSWNTELVLAAGGLATFTVPQSTKINIKGNLTITASRTISMAGATTTPLWFSGYTTNPGDQDADTTNALTKPVWTLNATFTLTASGTHQLWSGLSVVGNRSGSLMNITGTAPVRIVRMRVENTSSNAAAYALQNTPGATLEACWFKVPTTGTSNGVVEMNGGRAFDCVAEGGGLAGWNGASSAVVYTHCLSLNSAGVGFLATTGGSQYLNCVISNSTGDGIKWTSTPATTSSVRSCLFRICGGYGINNASGTNTHNVFRSCNDFYACTSNPENGFGDSPEFFGQLDSNDPVTSASNMTPVTGSNALNHGFPGIFENESFTSYAPIGAVVPQSSGGFTGIIGG